MSAAPLRFGHATESVDTVAPFISTDGFHHLVHAFSIGGLPRPFASEDSAKNRRVLHRARHSILRVCIAHSGT
jgi:hypothetical protein